MPPPRRAAASMLAAALALAACASAPRLTGIGAPAATFAAHHGSGYADVLTDGKQRVNEYVATFPPGTLDAAITRIRADLPADASTGTPQHLVGIEGTKCAAVVFRSETLQRVLGRAQVLAVFQTAAAVTFEPGEINHAVVLAGDRYTTPTC